ncbi:MAG: ABC transporter permease, partial [Muribaculaceae bacterium]|nr:ABC transporter permease [Muribaculaceae bacterium]
MSTAMFFEAIPDRYVDVPKSQWSWSEGSDVVPLIISKDYLTLYNFGFASAAGLPQLSEGLMSGIPLRITISSESGTRSISLHGRIAGYSNRLNTILVPQNFMEWSNRAMKDSEASPSDRDSEASPAKRLIVDVNSPGDVAIKSYLDEHDYEVAGDKTGASASFLLKLVIGIILIIGLVITILSLFILMLSLSLLMEKNRDKIHSLLMLGYPLRAVERPYGSIVIVSSLIAVILALGSVFLLRSSYLAPLQGLGAETASILPVIIAALILGVIIIGLNLLAIKRKVKAAWR